VAGSGQHRVGNQWPVLTLRVAGFEGKPGQRHQLKTGKATVFSENCNDKSATMV
jgi:hypothetical protein